MEETGRDHAMQHCIASAQGNFPVGARRDRDRGTRFLITFVLATLLVSRGAPAQTANLHNPQQALTQYKIDNWQTEQGLPLNTVQCLLQTREGYLWVGTGGGLARFDGVRFATFESSGMPDLASRSIFGLMEDAAGNLWIGLSDGAVIYRDGHFRPAFGREMTAGHRVWSFAQQKDGAVWAATENGLVLWRNGRTRLYQKADGIPSDHIRSIAIDRDGTLWMATSGGGLGSFANNRFSVLTPANGFPHLAVRHVIADPAGGVWAATAGGGLAHVDHGHITTYGVKEGLPTDQLTSLALDASGSLWIGTWGAGLCRLRDGRFTSISTEGGLAGAQIWSVYTDREGSVWVGTWVGGLNRLRNRDFVVLGKPEGLSSDNVRSVLHARNGVTWVTTAGGGVNRIQDGVITTIGMKDGLPSDETSTLMEERDGSIWIGTYTGGIAHLKDGKIVNYGVASGLPSLDVRMIFQDSSGTIWASSIAGLARFNGRDFTPVTEKGAPPEGASTIAQTGDGTIWFGASEGLFRYRKGVFDLLTRKDGLVSNWIMSLYDDRNGSLWIGTNGEGLSRFRNGHMASIRTGDGLWDGMIEAIIPDRLGNLWMTCNRGFFRASLAELNAFADGRRPNVTTVGYGPGDALRSTTFAGGHQPAGATDAAGNVWLPSFSGLVIVDPAHLPGSGAPPRVHIEEVEINGRRVSNEAAIVLPPGSVPLSIRYTTTPLRNADRARFRYRMGGTDGGWVDAGKSREAFFPALSQGRYEFRVAASADGKSWSETDAPLSITVRPYFFQTPWFLALAVLAGVGATAILLRLRTSHLRRQKEEMERLVAEKTEELKLANDHLARLSFVDSLTGLANRRRFDEALEQEWQRARRFGSPVALIMADVDLFKPYNDTLGHPEGDRCLAAVCAVFQQAGKRAGDLVARYGGEEFVVLIPSADLAAALMFAERLREECAARAIPHPASSVAPVVTISLGVAARIPSAESSSQALVMEADAALYRAKRDGRNRVAS